MGMIVRFVHSTIDPIQNVKTPEVPVGRNHRRKQRDMRTGEDKDRAIINENIK